MPDRTQHIGLPLLTAEREKLLAEYEIALKQVADDPVKVDHGNIGEAALRNFLARFLPKKYGVTKGHIITPDRDYTGPLEEWDIIVYDAMEAPVLFVRRTADERDDAGRRGIPVEYVRGVVEVKATFNKVSAAMATKKLLKLRQFVKPEGHEETSWPRRSFLPFGFRTAQVFFETKVKDAREYSEALGALSPFWQENPMVQFIGALIIRGQGQPDCSSSVNYLLTSSDKSIEELLIPECEASPPFVSFVTDMMGYIVSSGFGQNEFWKWMIEFVHALNGNDDEHCPPSKMTGGYGVREGEHRCKRLFPNPT
jgi:hypothetical protein